MKKILSILVMSMLFGVSYLYADVTITVKAVIYDETKSNAERVSGGGTVQAHIVTGRFIVEQWTSGAEGTSSVMSSTQSKPKYSASVKSTYSGYYFYQWEEADGTKIKEKSSNNRDIDNSAISANKTVYAVFKPVGISVAPTITINTMDLNGTNTGTLVFPVNNADDINDFQTPSISGEGFLYVSHSFANNQMSVVVRFTDYDQHNKDGEPFIGSVVLKSAGGESSASAKVNAISDLTPVFSVPATHDLTPTNPVFIGNYIQLIETDIMPSNLNNTAASAEWSLQLIENPTGMYALIEVEEKMVLRFTPTTVVTDAEATLRITSTYYDSDGTRVLAYRDVVISADSKEDMTPRLEIDGTNNATLDFGTKYFSNQPLSKYVSFVSMSVKNLQPAWTNNNPGITYLNDGSSVVVTINETVAPGDYSETLTYTADKMDGTGTLTATLDVVAKVRLTTPVLTAYAGISQIWLEWGLVYGATSYIIKSGEEVIATIDDPATTSHLIAGLTNGTPYTYTVTAVYASDEQYNTKSEEVTITPSVPITITAANEPYVGLYTGTEIFVEGDATYGKFPYRKKAKLDLRATFAPDGTPLFDNLYIFGLTISTTAITVSGQTGHKITPASNSKGSDAITPCYIYTKNGSGYDLSTTIPNMNVTNKPISDVYGTSQGVKVYLTGYCPYASTGGGNNKNENGIICFTGGAGEKVDVYVDDVQLYARYKSKNGNTSTPDTVLFSGLQTTFRCVGTSTAFAFKGTSSNSGNPFQPTIHMRDSNRLSGNTGSAVKVDIKVEIPFVGEKGMTQTAGQYNSPIGLLTDADKRYTTLSIDDIWPASMVDNAVAAVRTNGYLDIRTTTAAPCIDLYDQYGKVNFNGGRIYMKNSRPSGSNNYLCTFSVGYRMYSKTVEIASIPITATMYGLGTDQSGGEVNFNDGSFYIDPLTDEEFTKHGKYYHHKYALKCPASSTINGGTYYCEPFGCTESENKGASPLNKYGDGLVLDTIAVIGVLEPYKTAVINFPNDKENTATIDATHPQTLGEYYALAGRMPYGISSLNAYQGTQAPDSVILMLPVQYTDKELQKEVANVPWALCVPDVVAGGSIAIGGDVEVIDKEENNVIYQTNYLLYGAIDEYVAGLIGEGVYETPEYDGLPSAGVELTGGTYSDILNEEPYTIQQEQYMMMSVKADEWFLFAPPFDISAVYVLETAVETELETMAKNEGWQAAINKQAAANMDLFYALCYLIDYTESVNNFDGVFYSWRTDLKPAGAGGQVKLTHFTGSNWDKANYYVQRSSGTWEWDSEKSRFVTDWAYLPKTMEKVTHGETEYSVVMKKGEIYSLNFPYMYNGYRESGDGDNNWDYWTGKYILFVGKGPQTIEGKNYHRTITEAMPATPGTAEIRANSTFASMEVSGMKEYGLVGQQFIPNTSGEPLPVDATQGFVLLKKPTASPMPQRIKTVDMMSGEVTYEEGEGSENGATGTPTIAGNNKMLVYNINGGVGIVPVVAQQVSIYNAAGQVVTSEYLAGETQLSLPAGIYLVCGEYEQYKVLVK